MTGSPDEGKRENKPPLANGFGEVGDVVHQPGEVGQRVRLMKNGI
jgi:hypothetical protein